MRFPAAHTATGHTHILRRDGKVFWLGHPVDHGKARDQRLRSEFCTPAFPCPVQVACGPRDGRRRTRKGAASGVARSEQSHGRAAHGGSSPPNARRHHWSKLSTAPHSDLAGTYFEVTHPHHPLKRQK